MAALKRRRTLLLLLTVSNMATVPPISNGLLHRSGWLTNPDGGAVACNSPVEIGGGPCRPVRP